MRKNLCISIYCRIFASEKETKNKLNPKTRKGTKIMKTFTAAMRTISANDNNVKTMNFKTEEEAEAQAKMWFNELIEEGFVLTNIMLGRLSKEGTDAYIYVLN